MPRSVLRTPAAPKPGLISSPSRRGGSSRRRRRKQRSDAARQLVARVPCRDAAERRVRHRSQIAFAAVELGDALDIGARQIVVLAIRRNREAALRRYRFGNAPRLGAITTK